MAWRVEGAPIETIHQIILRCSHRGLEDGAEVLTEPAGKQQAVVYSLECLMGIAAKLAPLPFSLILRVELHHHLAGYGAAESM